MPGGRPGSILVLLLLLCLATLAAADSIEPALPGEVRATLTEWEGRSLRKADDIYFGRDKNAVKKQYRLAASAYKAFYEEFGTAHQSAICYALFQEGRSYQLDNKRVSARKCYDDILKFFPNEVAFATAAAYFNGLSFDEDGDTELAMRAWAVIAKDPEYRKQPLAGKAIVELATYTWKQGKLEQAAKYFRDVAQTFRHSNRQSADTAIDRVVEYHVRHRMDLDQLVAFAAEVHGFGHWRKEMPAEIVDDGEFWRHLRGRIRHFGGTFPDDQADQRKVYWLYWAERMAGRFPADDEYHKDRLDFRFAADGDRKRWIADLDAQYEAHQQPGDNGRTISWMSWHMGSGDADKDRITTKVKEYYGKLAFDTMSFDQKLAVAKMLFNDRLGVSDLGMLVVQKIDLEKISDAERATLARFMYQLDRDYVKRVIDSFQKDDEGFMVLLGLIARDKEVPLEEKVAVVGRLAKSQYHGEAQWILGGILKEERQYDQAISAFLASNRGHEMAFEIADCHFANKSLERCIGELTGIETMFKPVAAEAAMRQAYYLDKGGKAEQRNATLHRIIKQYKGSSQASKAHVWAEKLGLPFVGGELNEE